MMRVAAYTGGSSTPSARMRVRQYAPLLAQYGIDLHEYTLTLGKSMPTRKRDRAVWAAKTVLERAFSIPASYWADLTLISRNLMPGFLPGDRLTRAPRVLDVDDAIWLTRGGHRAGALARACDLVICGNSFLAEHFSQWNRNVAILPTAVDASRVVPSEQSRNCDAPVIGWTGTSLNFPYLYSIEPALQIVLAKNPRARLRVIAETAPSFSQLNPAQVDFVPWDPVTEISVLKTFTVGVMPLIDSVWERGKCSFKMLLYMAGGIPVVVSPIGMNREVLSKGEIGFGASTLNEWTEALITLLSDPTLARNMGSVGRKVIEEFFSVEKLAPVFAGLLHSVTSVEPHSPPAAEPLRARRSPK